MNQPLIVILGATAVGKTKLAVALADELDAEIISADSRQVFKGMDIGTGKDLSEYKLGSKRISYHLIDILDAGAKYHVNAFKEDFYRAVTQISSRHHLPILCGGTGMYIHSILQQHELTAIPINEPLRESLTGANKSELQERLLQYPAALRLQADFSSSKRIIRAIEIAEFLGSHELETVDRPKFNPLVIGLYNELPTRRQRIIERLNFRLNNGLIDEVKNLLSSGVSKEMLTFYGLEYKFIVDYLAGEYTLDELTERLGTAICQFAKRQMTFFRKMERDGIKIHWLSADQNFLNLKHEALHLIKSSIDSK